MAMTKLLISVWSKSNAIDHTISFTTNDMVCYDYINHFQLLLQ